MKYILFFKSYLINCHFLKTETRKLTSLSIFFSSQVFFCFSIAVLAGPTMQLFGYQLVLYLMATRARGQDWGQEQPQDETRAGQLVPGPEYRSSRRRGPEQVSWYQDQSTGAAAGRDQSRSVGTRTRV